MRGARQRLFPTASGQTPAPGPGHRPWSSAKLQDVPTDSTPANRRLKLLNRIDEHSQRNSVIMPKWDITTLAELRSEKEEQQT
ncbi:MAG: hypothetical protein VKM34_00675 [Cyanobacteriota bacterium]|nr:hypothetical protein [Cyanobacteriota bacterium]